MHPARLLFTLLLSTPAAEAPHVPVVFLLAKIHAHAGPLHGTPAEWLLWLLINLSPLLLIGAFVGAVIELKSPGFGLPGLVSLACFTLFFATSFATGQGGWGMLLCFTAGLILIISEIFLHPGTILPGLGGLALVLSSLLWAMIERHPGDPLWPSGSMLLWPLLRLVLALAGTALALFYGSRYLPHTSIYHRVVLHESNPPGALARTEQGRGHLQPGLLGHALTTLRPSGRASFEGHPCDVVSTGEYLPAGTPVRIQAIEGPRIVVTLA